METTFQYHVFVSYSHRNGQWVWDWLLPRLRRAGLEVCIDRDSFEPGAPSLTEMERAVAQSKKTLLVLTPEYLASEWCEFENILAQTLDPAARRRRVIPLLLEQCDLPPRIGMLTYADFTHFEDQEHQLERVIAAIKGERAVPSVIIDIDTVLMPLPPQPYIASPYPMQANFTGRAKERRELTEWFTSDTRPLFAYVAIGGTGKSALTWAWLQRDVLGLPLPGVAEEARAEPTASMSEASRPEGVLWWSFYERESTFQKFLDQALIYASGGTVDPRAIPSIRERMQALYNLLGQRRFLLVLDGVERILRAYARLDAAYHGDEFEKDERGDFRSCTDPNAGTFLRWLASGALKSKVLLTSRLFPRELNGLAGCRRIRLTAFDPEDAVIFFRAQGVKGTRAEIQAACAPYGYLPLALRLLSGLIVRDKRTPGDIRVASRYPVLPELKGREQHHILEVAYNALDEKKRELLSRISAFRSPMAYEALSVFNTYKSVGQFDAALDELIHRGLLLFDRERGRYDLHPIVRQYAYDRLADKPGIHTRLRDYFAAVPVPEEENVQSLEDLALTIELYHHTVRAGELEIAFQLLRDRLWRPLFVRLNALPVLTDLFEALFPEGSDKSLPALRTSQSQSWALNRLASIYRNMGFLGKAVRLIKMALDVDRKAQDALNVSRDLGNLAGNQLYLGLLGQAEMNFRQRIEVAHSLGELQDEAIGHWDLGRVLAYQGRFVEAEDEFARAQTILDILGSEDAKSLKPGYPTVTAMEAVLWIMRATKALLCADVATAMEQARRAYDRSVALENQYHIIQSAHILGAAYREIGKLDQASAYLDEAISLCRSAGYSLVEPNIVLELARLAECRGSLETANELALEVLQVANRAGYQPVAADAYNVLASIELKSGQLHKAKQCALAARECAQCEGPPHVYLAAMQKAERMLSIIDSNNAPVKQSNR